MSRPHIDIWIGTTRTGKWDWKVDRGRYLYADGNGSTSFIRAVISAAIFGMLARYRKGGEQE